MLFVHALLLLVHIPVPASLRPHPVATFCLLCCDSCYPHAAPTCCLHVPPPLGRYMEKTVGPDAFYVGENFVDLRWCAFDWLKGRCLFMRGIERQPG